MSILLANRARVEAKVMELIKKSGHGYVDERDTPYSVAYLLEMSTATVKRHLAELCKPAGPLQVLPPHGSYHASIVKRVKRAK